MRNAFAEEVVELAAGDDRLVLLSGDIGNRLFDPFKDRFADRFINCGVAEANMTGVAAGLALSGMRPITYTITAFNTVRCLEQIRVDLCYHDLPAVVVGVGSGLSYANLGYTHHSPEDIGFMRLLPNMTVLCPGDSFEVKAALHAAIAHSGPVYLRLGKKGERTVHDDVPEFTIGRPIFLKEGRQVCILAIGTMLPDACDVGARLDQQGISSSVVSFHTVKPLNTAFLDKIFDDYDLVVTVEEHSVVGGAGAAIAEWLADQSSLAAPLLRIALPDRIFEDAGNQKYARQRLGLTAEAIEERILDALRGEAS